MRVLNVFDTVRSALPNMVARFMPLLGFVSVEHRV